MKLRMIFLSVLFLTAFARISPLVAHAATYYVAKTGNNNNTCTQARSLSTPKHTIAAGLSCLSGGDTLIIKAGTYLEVINHKQVPSGISNSSAQRSRAQLARLSPSSRDGRYSWRCDSHRGSELRNLRWVNRGWS